MLRTCLSVLAAALMFCTPLAAEDWPRWGGPRGDATWHGPKLPDEWPEDGLPVVWKQPVGGGYSGVAVSGGRVYLHDRRKEMSDSGTIESERVRCFDAASGQPLWTHEYSAPYGKLDYGTGPRAMPTIADGRVYTLGAVGHFCCLDAQTGRVLWSHDFVKDFGTVLPMWGLAASPIIWKDLVIVHPGAQPGGCVMAFDRTTGKEAWRVSNDPAGYSTPIIAETPSGIQLICWTPEHVLGIAPANGHLNWSIPYKVTYGVSIATPLYHDGLAFVSGYWEGSKAIRLGQSPRDAQLEWEDNRVLRGLMAQPLLRDGLLYTIDKHYGLTCAELKTGRKLWSDDEHEITPRGNNPHVMSVWCGDDDRALLLNAQGDLLLARLNGEGMRVLSRTHIIDPTEAVPIWAHPAYGGTRIYARSDQELICRALVPER